MKLMFTFSLVLFSIIFLSACSEFDIESISDEDMDRISERLIVCEDPYIRHGAGCCLDTTGTGICDKDEDLGDEVESPVDEDKEEEYEDIPTENLLEEIAEDAPFIGDDDAPVIIVLWSDFRCPFCERFYRETLPYIKENYINEGHVKFVYRHFPVVGGEQPAEASACADEQDLFWQFHDRLFDRYDEDIEENFTEWIDDFDGNNEEFQECMDSDRGKKAVEHDQQLGTAVGVQGTPGFMINDEQVSGAQSYDKFEEIIESHLNNNDFDDVPEDESDDQFDMEELAEGAPYKGDSDAPVVIVEWSDFACPFCGRFYDETLGQIEQNYIESGDVKFVYRHFPVVGGDAQAEASVCADEQGIFWEFHDRLFDRFDAYSPNEFPDWIEEFGGDSAEFQDCLDSGRATEVVQRDQQLGVAAGVQGTPGFVINGELVSGAQPFQEFEQVIEEALD